MTYERVNIFHIKSYKNWRKHTYRDINIIDCIGNRRLNNPTVGEASFIKKGDWVNFDHLFYKNGFWWVRFKYPNGANNDYFFMSVGVRKSKVNLAKAKLWGTVTKLNSNKKTLGVTNWKKKGAVK